MKKIISIILTVIILASMSINVFAAPKMGDVNNDGKINSSDALEILRYSVGLAATLEYQSAADVNKDGNINSSDALEVLLISVGLKKAEPELVDYNGIRSNQTPFSVNGIEISSITYKNGPVHKYLYVIVKNNTGKAVSEDSYLTFKVHDTEGYVTDVNGLNLKAMNIGESCKCEIEIHDGTEDVIFLDAAIKEAPSYSEPEIMNYSRVMSNKTPYSRNGLMISSIEYKVGGDNYEEYLSVMLKNATGKAIDLTSGFYYKSYDAHNLVVDSGIMYTEMLNDGETCVGEVNTYGISKVVFYGADVDEGMKSVEPTLANYNGIRSNAVPYTTNGIALSSIRYNYDEYECFEWLSAVVKNNTGKAIDNTSSIYYKEYDKNGVVIYSDRYFIESLNNGESCECYAELVNGATKVVFFYADIIDGTPSVLPQLSDYGYIQSNSWPYSSNGISLEKVLYNRATESSFSNVFLTFENKTGKPTGSGTQIAYKAYDYDGFVIDSGKIPLPAMNNSETCNVTLELYDGTAIVVFYNAQVVEGTAFVKPELNPFKGIYTNKTPYTENGITITAIEYDRIKHTVTVIVRNDELELNDSAISVHFKAYNDIQVLYDSGCMIFDYLDKGESVKFTFYGGDHLQALYFYDVGIYDVK
ncbi:MAG: dockerin type I domain-containing protein [Clostridia bacterium]|nr:dockerin type I domain-containing protein [Clostridia bacterium]